jgi:hypothetical protein
VTLKMTLSEDLARQMDQITEEVPTSMGIDMPVSIVTLGPSVTVATTSLFTYEAFRGVLHHWFKHTRGPVSIALKDGRSRVSFELERHKANYLATEISEVVTKFIQAQPDKATSSTQGSP